MYVFGFVVINKLKFGDKSIFQHLLFFRFLTQLRQNRDEENKLMEGVDGWVTGTYYGEPVYNNPNNRFPPLFYDDFYAHNKHSDMMNRFNYHQWF